MLTIKIDYDHDHVKLSSDDGLPPVTIPVFFPGHAQLILEEVLNRLPGIADVVLIKILEDVERVVAEW